MTLYSLMLNYIYMLFKGHTANRCPSVNYDTSSEEDAFELSLSYTCGNGLLSNF